MRRWSVLEAKLLHLQHGSCVPWVCGVPFLTRCRELSPLLLVLTMPAVSRLAAVGAAGVRGREGLEAGCEGV